MRGVWLIMLRGTVLFGSLGSGRRRFEDVDTGVADLCVGLERFGYIPWVVQNELVFVSRFCLAMQAESLMILFLFFGREGRGWVRREPSLQAAAAIFSRSWRKCCYTAISSAMLAGIIRY